MRDDHIDVDLDVPGTTRILDERGEALGGANNFTLVPTPSSDPEDPLNWSKKRKHLQLVCMVLWTLGVCFCSGSLSAIYGPIMEETGLTLDQLNSGVGYGYLCIGLLQIFTQPLSLCIGKHPVYVISLLGAGCFPFWMVRVRSYGEFIGSQVFFGLMASPLFVMPELSLSDTYFYHERGTPFGIYVAATYGGAVLAPILGGYIYSGLGWVAPPYFAGGFCFLAAIFLIIFHEETNFRRDLSPTATANDYVEEHDVDYKDKNVATATVHAVPAVDKGTSLPVDADHAVHSKDRIVSPWPGPRPWRKSQVSENSRGIMLRGILYPLVMLRLPVVLWCGLIFALYQIFYNTMIALTSAVLSAPPYNFQPNSIGLTFLSPFIAIIPGAVIGGFVCDWYTVRRARKNNGISEAEHKLRLFIIPTILTPFGLLMIGLGPYYEAHWMVFVAGEFVLTVSGPLATLLSLTYAFDAFHEIEPENQHGPQSEVQHCAPYVQSLIAMAMVITFAFNYAITPWAFDWGFKNYAISAACSACAINFSHWAIIRWGKKMRRSGAPTYRKIINW